MKYILDKYILLILLDAKTLKRKFHRKIKKRKKETASKLKDVVTVKKH